MIDMRLPKYMCDVTIAVRFALDTRATGDKPVLKVHGRSTKANVIGFYNPIPPVLKEHANPCFGIVYKLAG